MKVPSTCRETTRRLSLLQVECYPHCELSDEQRLRPPTVQGERGSNAALPDAGFAVNETPPTFNAPKPARFW